jgi:hypothetical protein
MKTDNVGPRFSGLTGGRRVHYRRNYVKTNVFVKHISITNLQCTGCIKMLL